MLVGHADAAVHLDTFLDGERGGFGGLRLGDRGHQLGARVARIEQLGRLERGGAGDLDLALEMRGAVLQRLIFANEAAELLALLEIIEGHLAGAGRDANKLGSDTRPACVESAV